MMVLVLLVFISFMLVLGGVLLYGFSVGNHDLRHMEELALLPLESDDDHTH